MPRARIRNVCFGQSRSPGLVDSVAQCIKAIGAVRIGVDDNGDAVRFGGGRLNVIQIRIPPLRERPEALAPLVKHFLGRFNARFNKNVHIIDEQAQSLLRNYSFPGNVRELESIIAHAIIMADSDTVTARDLPDDVRLGVTPRLALPNYVAQNIPTLDDMEDQAIRTALEKVGGNQTKAAKKLGISRSTLWRKMKEYDITSEPASGS